MNCPFCNDPLNSAIQIETSRICQTCGTYIYSKSEYENIIIQDGITFFFDVHNGKTQITIKQTEKWGNPISLDFPITTSFDFSKLIKLIPFL